MNKKNYELEVVYRRMAEYQQQAERDAQVKELKEADREQRISIWRRLFGGGASKADQRPTRATNQPAYGQHSGAPNDE